jgi:hypothetical protein
MNDEGTCYSFRGIYHQCKYRLHYIQRMKGSYSPSTPPAAASARLMQKPAVGIVPLLEDKDALEPLLPVAALPREDAVEPAPVVSERVSEMTLVAAPPDLVAGAALPVQSLALCVCYVK